jgi:prophage antirepressor-like protein
MKMENNTILEAIDKQEAKAIYTRDMMDYEINVYGTEDEPLFHMKDVSKWLESNSHPTQLARMIDDEDKVFLKVLDQRGAMQNQLFITEDGLYEICMRSNLPKAKKVRKFIKNILKELRTKGYVATNNNIEIANAMTMIAQSLQPMQQALISMQQENEEFKTVILEEQYELKAKTQAIENTLNFLRIDGYELKTLTLTMADKRDKQRKFFKELSEKYNARESQISRVWDNIIYSGMYKHIGREKITPFENKSMHINQSVKDITKAEYPKCINFIESFMLDRVSFEEKIKETYKERNDIKKQLKINL